jgi:uncharacterized protein YndB with AHSA1/START domain
MEQKTKVNAVDGKQEITVTRDFELPLELLFKAHVEPDIIGQWMGTNVLKMEAKSHGSYQFETKDAHGNVVFRANGVIHTFAPNVKIARTFEMENTPFGIQLELYSFEKLTDDTSRLNMQTIFESVDKRDQIVKLGMVYGIGMAHDRLQNIANKLK